MLKLLHKQCTIDTLRSVMSSKLFQPDSCNRRNFLTAAGVLVVGSLFSCSKINDKSQRVSEKQLSIPTEMITMRIRVGKIRNKDGFELDGDHVLLTRDGWKLFSSNSNFTESPDQVMWVHNKETHTMIMVEKIKRCAGKISMHPRRDVSPHAFDIVVHVPMEEYLPGVIAGELYSHWHLATFAAQAVAARSYATAQHLQRKETSYYDVSDGPSSQVFLGDVTLDVAHRAVKDTQGVLLTWNNTVVPSYYSACCGGIAAAASDAISSSYLHNIPPLYGREGADVCTSLNVHQWKVKRPHESVKKRLSKWSRSLSSNPLNQLGSIESIIPTKTSKRGRPISFEIIDSKKNQHEITAKQLVRAMNTNYPTISEPTPKVRSSCLVASRLGSDIEFRGVGMGHGVGLCQYGAQVLAGQKMSWESILEWYYPKALVLSVS